jgi:hypothetical protein
MPPPRTAADKANGAERDGRTLTSMETPTALSDSSALTDLSAPFAFPPYRLPPYIPDHS